MFLRTPFPRSERMHRIRHLVPMLLFLLGMPAPILHAQTRPKSAASGLDEVLQQLETTGKAFRSFSARFSQKKYTSVLREFDTPESGEFRYARARDGSALLRQEVTKPAVRILTIRGGSAVIYQPALKQAQVANLGKNRDKAEYLALGLGQSPGKLRESFDLELLGTETLGSASCWMLLLKPKNREAAAYFSSITLWIRKSSGVPIQQKLQEPNGDYLLVSFTGEKLNKPIPESTFEQKLPAGVEILRIQ